MRCAASASSALGQILRASGSTKFRSSKLLKFYCAGLKNSDAKFYFERALKGDAKFYRDRPASKR
nr:hypothetical protein [uncultured Campylobacter sp.]